MTGGRCELCRRAVPKLTVHHLIPRSRHRNKRTRREFDRAEREGRLALLCPPCHQQVHAVLDEKTLARDYHSVAALAAHPEIARFVAWISSRPPGTTVTVHRGRGRRGR